MAETESLEKVSKANFFSAASTLLPVNLVSELWQKLCDLSLSQRHNDGIIATPTPSMTARTARMPTPGTATMFTKYDDGDSVDEDRSSNGNRSNVNIKLGAGEIQCAEETDRPVKAGWSSTLQSSKVSMLTCTDNENNSNYKKKWQKHRIS